MSDETPVNHPTCDRCDSIVFAAEVKVANIETGETSKVRLCDSCTDDLREKYGVAYGTDDPVAQEVDDE